ncbi:MAG: cytochrome c biogenesis CcdA family protein [Eubacteriales bacterium]|nr:cytochrome c biogenesis CcdA family protein [Eubacteriales bacterium]
MSIAAAAILPQATFWAMFAGGLVAFLSPCVLPMLPVYTLYLVGEGSETADRRAAWQGVLKRSLGLLLGFVTLFTLLGAGAGLLGEAFRNIDRGVLNIVTGALMIVFGLWTADFFHWKGVKAPAWVGRVKVKPDGFFSAALFGIVIALSWTPCLTPILANALILAASSATVGQGMLSLAVFALGLSLPMLLIMALYQGMKDVVVWLRDHQSLLRRIGGVLMIAYGLWLLIAALT